MPPTLFSIVSCPLNLGNVSANAQIYVNSPERRIFYILIQSQNEKFLYILFLFKEGYYVVKWLEYFFIRRILCSKVVL